MEPANHFLELAVARLPVGRDEINERPILLELSRHGESLPGHANIRNNRQGLTRAMSGWCSEMGMIALLCAGVGHSVEAV
jgi:hypothetical protein